MSHTAVEFVYRHSQATGATFAIHLAIADCVNSNHDWLFWMNVRDTAEKARVNKDTVGNALRRLVDLGYLDPVDPANGQPARYRFRFLEDAPIVFDTRAPAVRRPGHAPVRKTGQPACPENRTASVRKTGDPVRKTGQPRLIDFELEVELEAPNGHTTDETTPPLGQELVAFFVDISHRFGGEPTPRMKGQVGKELAKLATLGKPRRVLRRAVGLLAETGKPATALEWLVGEVEREIAGDPQAATP